MEVNRERWRAARINLLAALAALEEPTPGPQMKDAYQYHWCRGTTCEHHKADALLPGPQYTEDDPDWSAMVSPISDTDGGHDDR
jgi:hypothetical protein